MKHKLLLLSVTLLLTLSGIAYAAGVNGAYKGKNIVKVTYEGREVTPDKVPGYMDGSNTMVPLGMLRQMGVSVEWDQKKLTANVKLPPPRTVPVLIQSQLDELSKYVYKVTTAPIDGFPNGKQGSGFVVGSTLITAAHVSADAAYAQVQIDGVWQKSGAYSFVNKEFDLMGFPVTGGKSLPTSKELPQVNDPVYDISYPNGKLTITEGVVNAIMPINGIPHIKHSADTDGGGSGGVLVNGTGQIIGVNISGMDVNGESINYAIPISNVLDELNK